MRSAAPSFSKILEACRELTAHLTDVVFIGGVAVYLHSLRKSLVTVRPEASHDGDFAISFTDYGILKDEVEIVPNPRLGKHQMIYDDVEFDVYVDRLSRLVVPYDEIKAHAVTIEGIQVACPEHVLVLKLEALSDRKHSSKGDKDRRDVVKIGLLLGRHMNKQLIEPYIRDALKKLLDETAKSAIFFDLCEHNAHIAKKARTAFTAFVSEVPTS